MGVARPLQVLSDPAAAAALMDPLRRRLVELLNSPNSATGLAKRVGLPRQKVNYHLRELESAGLLRLVEERRKGNCNERIVQATAAHYLVSPDALGSLAVDPSNIRDRLSWGYLVALCARAIRELAVLRARADAVKKDLQTFSLHADIRFASQADLHAFSEELSNEVARLTAKYASTQAVAGGAGGTGGTGGARGGKGRVFRFFVGAHPAITKTEEEARAEAEACGAVPPSTGDQS